MIQLTSCYSIMGICCNYELKHANPTFQIMRGVMPCYQGMWEAPSLWPTSGLARRRCGRTRFLSSSRSQHLRLRQSQRQGPKTRHGGRLCSLQGYCGLRIAQFALLMSTNCDEVRSISILDNYEGMLTICRHVGQVVQHNHGASKLGSYTPW